MLKTLQKLFALVALAFMAAFVVAVIVLSVAGTIQQNNIWVYGTLSGFLLFGVAAIILRWAERKIREKQEREAKQENRTTDGNGAV